MLKLFKNFQKKDVLIILIVILCIVFQVYLDLKLPDYMSKITVLLQSGTEGTSAIIKEGAKMLACALGSLGSAVVVGYLVANVAAGFSKRLRAKLFDKVTDFSTEEIKKFSTSSLITRTTNDISHIQMLIVMGLQMIIKAPIIAIWALKKIANKGASFTLITTIGVAFIITLIIILVIIVMPKFKKMQTLTDNLNKVTRENLTGIRVIRAFNAEDYQNKKFNIANNDLTKTLLFTQKSMALLGPSLSLVMSGLSLAIYWVGAYLINAANLMDKISIFSDMVVFTSYAIQVIMSFMMLVIIFALYPRASISAKRINEVLNTKIKIKDGQITNTDSKIKGLVEFKNVSFKYPDAEEYMLKNISFKANAGEVIAFIGSTGSGKSTLVNLIPRFYDVTEGEILVDNINIKDYNQEYLHNKIGYISQKAILFKGTIKENISFGKSNNKITDKKIKEAIDVAEASDFVNKMKDKTNSLIAQSGTNISGGQKQRLSIARAIAKDPEIFIFDDSFSALDYKTDLLLRNNLKSYAKEATILIVAQRIGTIKNADKIIVLDEGKAVGIGTHKELIKKCEVYKEIALSQLSKEELDNE